MKNLHPKHIRVLGIAASSQGIGYAVMESENTLVDWGIKRAKGDKNARCLSHVGNLVAQYKPSVIALETTRLEGSRRRSRVQALIQQIVSMAWDEKIKVKRFSRKQLSAGFLSNDNGTKHDVARHLAARFPEELGFRLPPKRTVLMNEDCRMDMFDAVALAQYFLRGGE
jgi:Holliday junction resolvasome RuvABC endonuclease subunit